MVVKTLRIVQGLSRTPLLIFLDISPPDFPKIFRKEKYRTSKSRFIEKQVKVSLFVSAGTVLGLRCPPFGFFKNLTSKLTPLTLLHRPYLGDDWRNDSAPYWNFDVRHLAFFKNWTSKLTPLTLLHRLFFEGGFSATTHIIWGKPRFRKQVG